MLREPADLPRAFAAAWGARDTEALGALFTDDAEFFSLTGGQATGPAEIAALLAGELAGAFCKARLVTGRGRLRPLGQVAMVLSQRFVLSGLIHADGSDAGRIGAVLCATLERGVEGWQIVAAQFLVEA